MFLNISCPSTEVKGVSNLEVCLFQCKNFKTNTYKTRKRKRKMNKSFDEVINKLSKDKKGVN